MNSGPVVAIRQPRRKVVGGIGKQFHHRGIAGADLLRSAGPPFVFDFFAAAR